MYMYSEKSLPVCIPVTLLQAKTVSWHNQLSCELIPHVVDATERSGVVGPVPK